MSDKMYPIPFQKLVRWIIAEYAYHRSIFGIPSGKFQVVPGDQNIKVLWQRLDSPIGPAAGPHTQLTQNIVCSYLTGGRFFELKTVQKLDNLKIDKPCIDAQDEGYNVEWSQELTLDESYDEYLKAWMLIHFLKDLLALSGKDRGFIFNMSVGYDLEGIKTERMNRFIDELNDASANKLFESYKSVLLEELDLIAKSDSSKKLWNMEGNRVEETARHIKEISPKISDSVTLSTMHGCPPGEIEAIAKYLIEEKYLHTYVKLNPTLLGYEYVKETLHTLGYKYIELDKSSFQHDLNYDDAILMLNRLRSFASAYNRIFGIKLSNTLGVKNTGSALPGKDMYMSGRSLFPLTINLAYKLAADFNGDINISYSGGANIHNVKEILETGIRPVTFATDLLKPGGYLRLAQISKHIRDLKAESFSNNKLDLTALKSLAEKSLKDNAYYKESREIKSIKINKTLPLFDCYIAPCQEVCPIHQDVATYVKLVEQKRFEEAYELITSKNPLPHITGYICDHQCMYHCTRWDYDEPVLIRDLKKEAVEKGFHSYMENFNPDFQKEKNNVRVAVIGAGPSGLAASYFLARAGFDVTVLEKEMNAGGIVKSVLPRFRLPEDAIRKDIEFIEKHGIRFVFGFNPDFSIAGLKREGYKYIYIAIGAGQSNQIRLQGTDENVFDAIDFLHDYRRAQQFNLGKNVAVIGGGNSAMDSARAARRYDGVEKVYLIYRRTKEQMPADREEFFASLEDGVEYKELLLPVKFVDNKLTCQRMKPDKVDADGRMGVAPIENEFEEIEIDSVISAIGEHTDLEILAKNNISLVGNKARVNESNETTIENVFIGGDALRGPSTVVKSIADGKKVAEVIIGKENSPGFIKPAKKYFDGDNEIISTIENRKGEIVNQFSSDIHSEASRCLGCNLICNKCVEVCPNRANVAIDTGSFTGLFNNKYQVLHIDALCNECGNCETFCPHQNAPYKDKLTLFTDEASFLGSNNNGFYVNEINGTAETFVRYKSVTKKIALSSDWKSSEFYSSVTEYGKEFEKIETLIEVVMGNYHHLLLPNS